MTTALRSLGSPEPRDAGRGRLNRLALACILALALALQLATLARVHGYAVADSVEYLERAAIAAAGEPLDPGTVRSFAFSALLAPIVMLFSWAGDHVVFGLARALAMAIGLAAIAATAQLAARALGPRAGLAAAFLMAVNPVFLIWTVEPLSGGAVMLCAALAARAALERGGFKRGLGPGAWLGAGVLLAFQALLVLAAFALVLVARERWRGRAYLAGFATAILGALFFQALLDLWVYGAFGSSLWQYFLENGAGTVSTNLYEFGQKTGIDAISRAGLALYNAVFEGANMANQAARYDLRSQHPRDWYVTHLHTHLLAWPLYACLALGIVRALVRASWITTLLLVTLVLNVWMMSVKGSQSFRLWLPLLPSIAVLGAGGWAWLRGGDGAGLARRVGAALLLAFGGVLSFGIVRASNLGKHGGYWDAMAFIDAAVSEEAARAGTAEDPPPVRVAAGYHWAVRFRARGAVEDFKLPYPLYGWSALTAEERTAVLEALAGADWFISHLQLIEQAPEIARALNERFEVAAAFYDRATYEELRPVLVLRRRTGGDAPTLYEVRSGIDPGAFQATLSHPRSIDMRRRLDAEKVDQIVLLGWDARVLPGSANVGWLTLHWYSGPMHGCDYTCNLRLTDPDDRVRQRNLTPTWGVHPTSTWQEGWVVSDGMPFELSSSWDDLGGAYCRGDLLPIRIWMALPRYETDDEGRTRLAGGLTPFHPSGARPVHKEMQGGRVVSSEGWIFSRDNLVLVGGVFLPVPAKARVPDDGRPLVVRLAAHE